MKYRTQGQPLEFLASEANETAEVVNRFLGRRLDGNKNALGTDDYIAVLFVNIQNDTAEDLEPGHIVEIDPDTIPDDLDPNTDPIAAPGTPRVLQGPTLSAKTFTTAPKFWAIMMEPAPVGTVGQAAVAGLAWSKCLKKADEHQHAKPIPGDPTRLETTGAGPNSVRIRWAKNTVDVDAEFWALVELPPGQPTGTIIAATTLATDPGRFLVYPVEVARQETTIYAYDAFIVPTDGDPYDVLSYLPGWTPPADAEKIWLILTQPGNFNNESALYPEHTAGPVPDFDEPPTPGHPAIQLTPYEVTPTGETLAPPTPDPPPDPPEPPDARPVYLGTRKPIILRATNPHRWFHNGTDWQESAIWPFRIIPAVPGLGNCWYGDGDYGQRFPRARVHLDGLSDDIHLHHDFDRCPNIIPFSPPVPPIGSPAKPVGDTAERGFHVYYDGDRWRPLHVARDDFIDAILCEFLLPGFDPGTGNVAVARVVDAGLHHPTEYPYGIPSKIYSVSGGTEEDYFVQCQQWWIHDGEVLPPGTRVTLEYDPRQNILTVYRAQCPGDPQPCTDEGEATTPPRPNPKW